MDKYSEAEWYVALNADVDLSTRQLDTLIEQADSHGYALVAPLRREPWGVQGRPSEALPTPSYFFNTIFRHRRYDRHRRATSESDGSMTDAAWIGGCCMAIRGDLMRELRFDERYFMYFEDVDLSQRAGDLGARVGVCTTVTIDHATGWKHDDPLIARRGVEYARSAILYAEAHGHSPRMMRAATLAWASTLTIAPGREAAARAASRAIARGLVPPSRPGLAELASLHNRRHSFPSSF
jgi:GT2 family glycosyltransferase